MLDATGDMDSIRVAVVEDVSSIPPTSVVGGRVDEETLASPYLEGDASTNPPSAQEGVEAREEACIEVVDVLELKEEVSLEDASGELLSVPRLLLEWRFNMYMEASPYWLNS
ncbi:hypothetical protein GUJ93_ZPchr0009g1283 [Zizania palustris]|uniref:Uncharacterized protein n=1 Tax=Zizania palustris TaxID=103762 RepID=A0A8J5V516_ZIZPA|nr:hypothetical protein GUJ93_ZPchr0009g1283 [Zizania palustris]